MAYRTLRECVNDLEQHGHLVRVNCEVDARLEIAEIQRRVCAAGGPALLFDKPKAHSIPVLGNLFGTARRVALGMGRESVEELFAVERIPG